ncbi:GGDEF domain-containing protein [soil metagenome]
MVRWLRRWPHQTDQFDWFSSYIKDRGMQMQWRGLTFVFTASLATMPIVLILSPTGPDHAVTIGQSILASACAAAGAVLWLTRWPTRRQSMLFCLAAMGSIAAACLAQSNPYASLMGCTTFAVIGGFVAYFHTYGMVILNFAVASICAVIGAARLISSTGDIALTGSAVLIVAGLNVGVPFGIHSLTHALRSDLRTSGHDPLTGLLNRRSFEHASYELLMRNQGGDNHLIITMIDLDKFKKLNDTQGHAVGDQALVSVAAALRDNCRHTAVIGRAGGEEFVIADTGRPADHAVLAERLREAIAAIPQHVTASIGTAAAPLTNTSTKANQDLIEGLTRTADAAMYKAKRAGGDQVYHHPGSTAREPIHGR